MNLKTVRYGTTIWHFDRNLAANGVNYTFLFTHMRFTDGLNISIKPAMFKRRAHLVPVLAVLLGSTGLISFI